MPDPVRIARLALPALLAVLVCAQLAAEPVREGGQFFNEPADVAQRAAINRSLEAGKGVVTLPSLRYSVLRSGPAVGRRPSRNSVVKVRYEVGLADGRILSSTQKDPDGAQIFELAGRIPGFVAIVQLMRPGDTWRVYVPAEMAYPTGDPAVAGKPLIFKLELVDFRDLPPSSGSPLLKALPQ